MPCEDGRAPGPERVEDEAGKDEVVGPEAVRCEPLVGRISVVDLGQHGEPDGSGNVRDPTEELPDPRLDHETGGPGLLDDVSDGVEPDDRDAVAGEELEPAADQAPGRVGRHVEIDLL